MNGTTYAYVVDMGCAVLILVGFQRILMIFYIVVVVVVVYDVIIVVVVVE